MFWSGFATARSWHWRHAKAAPAPPAQADSADAKSAQDSTAQEQTAQDQSASTKSEEKKEKTDKTSQAPESTGKPADSQQQTQKENNKEAPAEPNAGAQQTEAPNSGQPTSSQPGPGQAQPGDSSAAQPTTVTTPQPAGSPNAPAPQTVTPEIPERSPAPGPPASPNEKSSPASASRVGNHNHKNGNRTKVIREGGTADANALLSPSMSMEQASRQIQNTTQLLASAQANLQRISKRKLTTDQQAIVDQVHSYVQQATDALNRGDLQRGHNLALKANLLADDLARH
jgi:hypothetical protein